MPQRAKEFFARWKRHDLICLVVVVPAGRLPPNYQIIKCLTQRVNESLTLPQRSAT
jgi:hypothetical protein